MQRQYHAVIFGTSIHVLMFHVTVQPKFSRLKISQVREWPRKLSPTNFQVYTTDARSGWKLDHENFICENLFLSRIWQNCKIFNPRKL